MDQEGFLQDRTSLVTHFIETRGPLLHSAFSMKSLFNRKTMAFEVKLAEVE